MITVTVGEQKPQDAKPFPKLMMQLDKGWVLLMWSATEGIHLKGQFAGDLTEKYNFDKLTVDYNEPITIQNA